MRLIKYIKNIYTLFESNQSDDEKPWIDAQGNIYDIKTIKACINEAKNEAMHDFPALGSILGNVNISPVNDIDIDTFATDGNSIVYSPRFAQHLIDMGGGGSFYIEYVLLHEALHVLFAHCEQGEREFQKYPNHDLVNIATDLEVNYTLENYLRIPGSDEYQPFKGVTHEEGIKGHYDDKYADMLWEDIYDDLHPRDKKVEKEKTSDEWKAGFIDGYNEIINELKNKKLIEQYHV